MELNTTYRRDSQGSAKAETHIPFGDVGRRLYISTYKSGRGGIVTTATVVTYKGDGCITHAIGFGVCGDYSKRLADDRGARCTEKNIRAQHERCIAEHALILADAETWYATGRDKRQA
jgi:hypothetical protein